MIKYDIEREKRIPHEVGPGKEKTMVAVIRKSYLYLESLGNASLDHKERSINSVCSDKIRLIRKTVVKDAGLSE